MGDDSVHTFQVINKKPNELGPFTVHVHLKGLCTLYMI